MRKSDHRLVVWFRTAPSDAAALRRFAAFYQHELYAGGLDLPNAFFQADIREPWKTLAATHQIWAWIGADGFYHFAEDQDMACFDPVIRAGLALLGLGGYEVIRAFRADVVEHPEFWRWDWQCHIPADPWEGCPMWMVHKRANSVLDRYNRYWLRFWSQTWSLEGRLGEYLRRSGAPTKFPARPAKHFNDHAFVSSRTKRAPAAPSPTPVAETSDRVGVASAW